MSYRIDANVFFLSKSQISPVIAPSIGSERLLHMVFRIPSIKRAAHTANVLINCLTKPFFGLHRRLPFLFSFRALCWMTIAFLLTFNINRRRPAYMYHFSLPNQATQAASVTSASRNLSARIFSLNAFIRPVLVGINDYKNQRLAHLLQALQPYDIVCLQELFWTSGLRKAEFLEILSSEHGFRYYASSSAPGFPGLLRNPPKIIDAGLVVVSKYPIVKTDYHTFSHAIYRSIDFLVAKGVLYTRLSLFLDKSERYVHVFTTHMQANNGLEDVPFEKIRRTQLTEIAGFMQRMTGDDANGVVIIAGDFNVNGRAGYNNGSSSDEYSAAVQILQSFRPRTTLRDLLYVANNFSHPVTTAGGLQGMRQKNERLDYIFLSSDITGKAELVAEAVADSVHVNELRVDNMTANSLYDTLSDHYGLQAEILFSEPETQHPNSGQSAEVAFSR